ncbi:MAG: hypothetical protein M3355_11910 [Actinomycetota bacterium]|nr:hypothetical protein [Actinomycetota bacterium]
MSRREDVDNAIWGDPDFLHLSAPGRFLYLWSFTNPLCNMAGVYKVGQRTMAFDTGLTSSQVAKGFRELREFAFWVYHDPYLWVRSRVKHLRTRTEPMARSIHNVVEPIDPCHPIRQKFLSTYGDDPWLRSALAPLAEETRSAKPKVEYLNEVSERFQGKGKGYG